MDINIQVLHDSCFSAESAEAGHSEPPHFNAVDTDSATGQIEMECPRCKTRISVYIDHRVEIKV